MKRRLGAIAALLLLCAGVARADDRTITHSGAIPSSQQINQQTRNERTALGIFARDMLGTAALAGTYVNLSVVPNGGLFVAVQPTSSGAGSIYQIGPEDPLPLPQNEAVQLATDISPILLHGSQNGPVGGVGPMSAPTSGNSVIYLVEAQLSTVDGAAQTVLFQNVAGGTNVESLPILRTDKITYQVISGAAASSPTAPTVTSGWVAIATVKIPSGTTAITNTMITPAPPFGGFIAAGGSPTVSGLTLAGATSGCLQTNSSGVVSSLPCTSGLGSVVAGFPLTSSTASGVANIGCPTCVTSVVGGTGVSATTGTTPTISLSHGDYADLANAQIIGGAKTLTGLLTLSTGIQNNGGLYIGPVGTATSSTNYPSNGVVLQNSYYVSGSGSTTVNSTMQASTSGGITNWTFSGYNGLSNLEASELTLTSRANASSFVGSSNNTFNFYQSDSSCGSNGYSATFNSSSVAVNGITATEFGVGCSTPSQAFGLALDTAGDLGIGGALHAAGVVSTGNVYSNNGVFASPANVPLQICPNNACTAQFNTGGGLSLPAIAVSGLSSTSYEQIGPNSPTSSNYIVHGQTGTYPYYAGVYNGNAHFETWAASLAAGATSSPHGFTTTFMNPPLCFTGFNQISGTSGAGYTATSQSVTLENTSVNNATITVLCLGS